MDWTGEGLAELTVYKERDVEQRARQRLAEDRLYNFYFREIHCRFDSGILTLEGRVPTFHLKQVLQTMLFGVEGVDRIDNRVDVVNVSGVSSVRSSGPK
jgi:hypothetical protein